MAQNRAPGVYLEDLCFEAQQAAEKAIKAVMIMRGVEFPYAHDLGLLLSLLEQAGEVITEAVAQAVDLTDYATTTRYPAMIEPVTEREHVDAVKIAEAVIRWAEGRL